MIEDNGRRMLVTAGNTAMPIDSVRVLTNIFTGKTGEAIALAAARSCWDVVLLTSVQHAEEDNEHPLLTRETFRTFDDLDALMARHISSGRFDAVVHSAAVSDYRVASVRAQVDGSDEPASYLNLATVKIPSSHERLFLELVPTPKLVDKIRSDWGFKGTLVKFKLQSNMSDADLLAVAKRSMADSKADFIVANCLEWSKERAYIVSADGQCVSVQRPNLPLQLLKHLK